MTTLRESLDRWLDAAGERLATASLEPRAEQIGVVEQAGDGIAFVRGLPDLPLGGLMAFEGGSVGFAHALDEDRIGCVLLDAAKVEAGEAVRDLGTVAATPVGEGLLGRVVDPLGRPLDREGPITAVRRDPVERRRPGIVERDLVTRAAADRDQADRRPPRARPRAEGADHRRPRDRQDRDRRRRDHSTSGART